MKSVIVGSLLSFFAPSSGQYAAAMQTPADPPPQIVVSAHADVKVTPDRATIQISVQTRAATAAAAATDNASRQQAVVAAIRALGIVADQIGTTGYSVTPEYRYDQGAAPVPIGYVVTNTITVDVKDLALVPKVIDASLSKGANMVSSLEFYASNIESARREAIAAAVAKARADAEAAARAAGGSLGTLLEISIGAYSPPPRPMFSVANKVSDAVETPINPGQQTLRVDVTTRWLFILRQ